MFEPNVDSVSRGPRAEEAYKLPRNSPLSLLEPETMGDGNRGGPGTSEHGWVLEDECGNMVDVATLQGKMVGFYFSAGWCPPCRSFSPQLADFCNFHAPDFTVVFVSSDHSEAEMGTFVKGKGFLRVRFGSSVRHQLVQYLGINMLPTLVICNADTGAVVTHWGRMALMINQQHCLREWQRGTSGVSISSMLGLDYGWLQCMG